MNTLGWSLLIAAISTSNATLNNTSNGLSFANPSISTIILALGGWSVVILGISAYIGNLLAEKMKNTWNAEENKKLEQIRADFSHEHSVFKSALDSYSSEFQSTQPNRIKAIELLWENILLIRRLGGIPLGFYGLFYENEFNTENVHNKEIMYGMLRLIDLPDISEKISSYTKEVEKCRPFLGEYLWTLFKTYANLIARTAFLLTEDLKTNNIKCWHKNEYTRSIIEEVFSDDEKKYIYSLKINSFQAATETLERKILYEMATVVSGELAANNNFKKAVKIQQLLKDKLP